MKKEMPMSGFIQGYWLRKRSAEPTSGSASLTFQGPHFFAVLRQWTTGKAIGPVLRPEHGTVDLRALDSEPGQEALLYLFDSEPHATDFRHACEREWTEQERREYAPKLRARMLPEVEPDSAAAHFRTAQSFRHPRGIHVQAAAGAVNSAEASAARALTPGDLSAALGGVPIAILDKNATVQAAAPGTPPEWDP